MAEIADAAEATVESPAPARNAAIPAIAAAPVFPRPPAITRTWPYKPLFESDTRGRNNAAKSVGADIESRMLGSPSNISGGVPIGTTCTSPASSHTGDNTRLGLRAVNVTVCLARTALPDG